jgi:hypothetical protein
MLLNQLRGKGNRCGKKAVGTATPPIRRFSAGGERKLLSRLVICGVGVAVRTAGAAGLDGARAPAAFGAAAEATIDLLWITRQVRSCAYGIPDIVVAKDVAGTNDHRSGRPIGDAYPLG